MKRVCQSVSQRSVGSYFCSKAFSRNLHNSTPLPATVLPITASGPPPAPAVPSVEHVEARLSRRKEQAELLRRGQDMRNIEGGKGGSAGMAGKRRFWKNVHVHDAEEGLQIYLDKRPLRRPNREILTIPHYKPHLASAIALEWDLLVSAQQALKHHLIPLTSLSSRALDIVDSDNAATEGNMGDIRQNILDTMMRYLDTDSLLCWAPRPAPDPPGYERHASRIEPLRDLQQRAAESIIAFLESSVWPGVKISPVLDGESIIPKPHEKDTTDVVRGWVSGLPAWELAGLERGVLAQKSLLGAVRLVVEWSAELAHLRRSAVRHFGVEEAARVASLEVEWQTGMWGVVEDTHDVEREDLRRQLGSVVLLVSGVEN